MKRSGYSVSKRSRVCATRIGYSYRIRYELRILIHAVNTLIRLYFRLSFLLIRLHLHIAKVGFCSKQIIANSTIYFYVYEICQISADLLLHLDEALRHVGKEVDPSGTTSCALTRFYAPRWAALPISHCNAPALSLGPGYLSKGLSE